MFIRRGRYPDYKGPVPFIPGYDLVGLVEKVGPDVASPHEGQVVADLCVVGGFLVIGASTTTRSAPPARSRRFRQRVSTARVDSAAA